MGYHTFTSIRVHIVFGASDSTTISESVQPQLWAYIAGIVKNVGGVVYAVNGARDHVHVFVGIPANLTVSELVQKVKANSSRWLHEQCEMPQFSWQEGYGAFSVSISHTDKTISDIRNQPEHHKRRGYGEELAQILSRHQLT